VKPVARAPTASVDVSAILPTLRRIDPEQPNAFTVDFDGVSSMTLATPMICLLSANVGGAANSSTTTIALRMPFGHSISSRPNVRNPAR
jgi:hypothetical protein